MTTMFAVLAIVVVVSMGVAVLIWGLVALLGRQPAPKPAPAPAAAPRPAAAGGDLTQGGHPRTHIAVIAAAVASVTDDGAVIVRIDPARGGTGWASEGRAAHHGSHNLGRLTR